MINLSLVMVSIFSFSQLVFAEETLPPIAKKIPHPVTHFGEVLPDDYFWLRDQPADGQSFKPEVLNYINAENSYTDSVSKPWSKLRATLASEIQKNQAAMADFSAPTLVQGYQYLQVTLPNEEYPSYVRKKLPDGAQEVLLSGPKLAGKSHYFDLQIGGLSPDGKRVAFGIDRLGDRNYSLNILNIDTGEITELRKDKAMINANYEPVVWSTDSRVLFYAIKNEFNSESGISKYDLAAANPAQAESVVSRQPL